MMVSFYRPTASRFKIIVEAGAFPSDQYAFESQAKFHGYDPAQCVIELKPRPGEHNLRQEDIEATIREQGASVALVLLGGVNYYTGQFFDLEAITKVGHEVGAVVGFDLAHAAGNLPLQLHDWGVDFAVWCSYKYLNSGPGGPSGVFVHERHGNAPEINRFAGWWGYRESDRFEMKKGFVPMPGADGWQLSNAQIFSFAAHKASLDIFHTVGMAALRTKSLQLTGYLLFLLEQLQERGKSFTIITPKAAESRGAQVSMLTDERGRGLYDFLSKNGVICDWREPNVIRIAPVPLYNSYEDVYRFAKLIESAPLD
jgi:kynureninase